MAVDNEKYDDAINLQSLPWYFDQCAENRELLASIQVIIPVRPSEGLNIDLARKLAVWYGEGTPWCTFNDSMGGFIEITRAAMAKRFLEECPNAKYLLMIDNDMEPPINLPYLLARHDKPVVGSCALSIAIGGGPQLCFSLKCADGKYRFPDMHSNPIMPSEGLLETPHVGTGAMLVRRDVLEAFTYKSGDVPFYLDESIRIAGAESGELWRGEDIEFCRQVKRKGFGVYVDLEAHVGHRKSLLMAWPENQRDKNMSADSWINQSEGHVFSEAETEE